MSLSAQDDLPYQPRGEKGPSGGEWRSLTLTGKKDREERTGADCRIARAVGLFAVGVVFLRSSWGSALVPVF